MGEPSEAYRRAMLKAHEEEARHVLARAPFRNRKFSDRTVNALVQADILAPERLLFMTMMDLRTIPGIGKVGLAEIVKYRSRFIPDLAETA